MRKETKDALRKSKHYTLVAEHAGVGYSPLGSNVQLFEKIDKCLTSSSKAAWCWILAVNGNSLQVSGAALILTKQVTVMKEGFTQL